MKAALAERTSDPKDRAVEELAVTYAREIDLGGELAKIGPALLAALTALLLTPASVMKGVKDDGQRPANPLDELRQRRAARTNRTADLDSAPPAADA